MKMIRPARISCAALLVCLLPLRALPGQETLRVAVQQEPGTLNPVIGTLAVETDAVDLLFDGLFRRDEQGNLVPDLAMRVPTQRNGDISRDGLAITYRRAVSFTAVNAMLR